MQGIDAIFYIIVLIASMPILLIAIGVILLISIRQVNEYERGIKFNRDPAVFGCVAR